MSLSKTFAMAASAVALLALAPASLAQSTPLNAARSLNAKAQGEQELLGGPGYQNRDGDRSYQDRTYQDRNYQDRDGRDWNDGNRNEGGRDYGDRGFGDRGWSGGSGMRGLEGLRVDGAKNQLRRSGYSYVRAVRESGRQYDLWWDGRSCVGFTSYRGRVTDARAFRDAECGDITRGRRIEARELEGLWVDAAKTALRRAGLSYARSIRVSGRQYDLWSGYGRGDQCVGFTSYNGRVTDARQFSGRECY